MKQTINFQDMFLNKARIESQEITIFLVNGYQLKGRVMGFDNYTIILEADTKQQLIYKHAVATIVPISPIKLNE